MTGHQPKDKSPIQNPPQSISGIIPVEEQPHLSSRAIVKFHFHTFFHWDTYLTCERCGLTYEIITTFPDRDKPARRMLRRIDFESGIAPACEVGDRQ